MTTVGTAIATALVPLVGAVASAVLFVRGFRRLRHRRPDLAGWGRLALFLLALGTGLVALTALDTLAEESLAAHMLQHVLLADVAPALALVALRGPLLFFVVPAFVSRAVARSHRARAVLAALTRPAVAFGVWAGILALWHVPVAYENAVAHPPVHVLEHASFVLAGTLAWIQVIDPARRRRLTTTGRLGFVVAMLAAGQALAVVLVGAQSPIYERYSVDGSALLGFSALADQEAAGFLMMVEQLLVLGLAAALLLRRHLAELAETGAAAEQPAHPFLA